jgi:hypothetical protein
MGPKLTGKMNVWLPIFTRMEFIESLAICAPIENPNRD